MTESYVQISSKAAADMIFSDDYADLYHERKVNFGGIDELAILKCSLWTIDILDVPKIKFFIKMTDEPKVDTDE
ncbi:hypothetical protein MFLO_15608 [Listeria floridensis FSL S10-1187]|uniref:Uncharacterized protein n=1 Tax=Listeria floridensis FSL S10-1187 TaxID=1265817 RepID=A0ABN0RBD1_9LIST|nr:hypothetical protein [Listeria floridensis]EUJ25079.1 hypothetical protein MFLO_15608 [Listeria floridensis FSL S10-1187]